MVSPLMMININIMITITILLVTTINDYDKCDDLTITTINDYDKCDDLQQTKPLQQNHDLTKVINIISVNPTKKT